jgi:branched-chain amino acid transport system ATP-binding protein
MLDSRQAHSVLDVRNLWGGWGPTTVIENVSLTINAGETAALIGRNGVGKTTLLELITGRAQRHSGEVWLGGTEISRLEPHRRSALGLGLVPQEREVFPSLTVRENIAVAQRPGPWSEEHLFTLFPSLAERYKSLGWQLSGGEQQMLSIARALAGNPTLLLMDEPTEGLAPVVVQQLQDALRNITAHGSLALLLIEQRIDIVCELATRCLIIDRGRVVHEATSASLAEQPELLGELMGLG